jgi:hypothetical protein
MNNILTLLGIGVVVGVPGIIAWRNSTANAKEKLFETGPAILIPIVVVWTAISYASCEHESVCSRDLWRTMPYYALLVVAAIWLSILIAIKKDRVPYIAYALVYLPCFYLFCMLAQALAIKFPL